MLYFVKILIEKKIPSFMGQEKTLFLYNLYTVQLKFKVFVINNAKIYSRNIIVFPD